MEFINAKSPAGNRGKMGHPPFVAGVAKDSGPRECTAPNGPALQPSGVTVPVNGAPWVKG
jgi:hypothetical protein